MRSRHRGLGQALILIAMVLAVLLLLTLAIAPPRQQPRSRGPQPERRTLEIHRADSGNAADRAARFHGPTPALQVGIQIKNIYNLQLEDQTFSADGWYWMRWGEELEAIRLAQQIPAMQMVEFLNQVEVWNSTIEPETPEPVQQADGLFNQLVRFSARFSIDAIDQHRSPFEKVMLPIVLETRPAAFRLGDLSVRLEPDPKQETLVNNYADLTGYRLQQGWLEKSSNSYGAIGPKSTETYSQLIMRLVYCSEPRAAFTKWILPVLIVMSVVLLAPSLEGSLGEMRLAIPSTALLTLVFMQQTYKSELPVAPYLTFLDEIYAYCYIVALGLFILFLWSSNQMEAAAPQQRSAVRARINRIDGVCQISACIGLAVVALLAWFL